LPILIIIAATFIVYARALGNDFVYDDLQEVLANKWVTDLGYIPEIFSSADWDFMGKGYPSDFYRPTLHFSFLLINTIFGMKAWAFHLQNVAFHALNAVVLYFIALRLMDDDRVEGERPRTQGFYALLGSLVFVAHPLNVEPVSWVSSISDLHFAFFALLSVYFYMRGGRAAYAASVALFFLSAVSKETAAVVPVILIGYDLLVRKTPPSAVSTWLKRYAPFVAAGAVYIAIRMAALGVLTPSEDKYAFLTDAQYAMNVAVLFAMHMWKLVLPTGLTVAHVFTPALSPFESTALASFGLIAAMLFIFAYCFRGNRVVSFSILWIILPTVPILMFAYRDYPFSERYLYLSAAGFALLLSILFYKSRNVHAKVSVALAVALIAVYSVASFARAGVWKDESTLWADAAEKAPGHARAHYSHGYALYRKKMYPEAIEAYKRAIAIKPLIRDWRYDLALAYQESGRLDEAIAEYSEGIRLGLAGDANTRINLGNAYAMKGLYAEAVGEYEIALSIAPGNQAAAANLRVVRMRMHGAR
jgi:hypothetical protein